MDTIYFLLGTLGCIIMWFFNLKFIDKFIEPIRKYPYTKFKNCNPPLGTGNGIGFVLYQGGRKEFSTNSEAWYLFFCFIIPLFPVGCYRATQISSGRRSSYKIYGHEKWKFWEVISIYLAAYSWIGGIICIIGFIASFFD